MIRTFFGIGILNFNHNLIDRHHFTVTFLSINHNMPPKKRNKAYTKKRKGKSKGVASTAAKTTPATGGTKATKATTWAFESAATEQPQKKMRLAGTEDEVTKAFASAGGTKATTGAKSSASSSSSAAAGGTKDEGTAMTATARKGNRKFFLMSTSV